MHLKDLCKEAHRMAEDKGFWDQEDPNISEKLMLIVTELGEACEALRTDNRQWIKLTNPSKSQWAKDTFEDEIADTFIRLGDLCEALDIDIEWQIKQKMQYNKTRPAKHGKEF